LLVKLNHPKIAFLPKQTTSKPKNINAVKSKTSSTWGKTGLGEM
jgi:hypothetical protein